jgi:two-component system CheB/CheR fusion protein
MSFKCLRILLVEDSNDILTILKTELEFMGYVVEAAADGSIGLEAAERFHPDVIVSDIAMPGLDGFEFLDRIRQTPVLKGIPVIALSGLDESASFRGGSSRFDAHIAKPVEPRSLSALIQTMGTQPNTSAF